MAKKALSKTQVDRLGDRLRKGPHTEDDLRLLDDYRLSFGEAYEAVVRKVRDRGEFPTGRLAKSTLSIVEKLRRESIRLSQMQDIAGCRVVVADVAKQGQFVASLTADFTGVSVMDRREKPSYGYRAVHVIVDVSGKPIEVQVRTALQHMWAELSEKASDVLDPTIKYGGGSDEWLSFLTKSSEAVAAYETFEGEYAGAVAAHEEFEKATAKLLDYHPPAHEAQEIQGRLADSARGIVELHKEQLRLWRVNADLLTKAISRLDKAKGKKR